MKEELLASITNVHAAISQVPHATDHVPDLKPMAFVMFELLHEIPKVEAEQHLLGCLEFPSMRRRESSILPAHAKTFE